MLKKLLILSVFISLSPVLLLGMEKKQKDLFALQAFNKFLKFQQKLGDLQASKSGLEAMNEVDAFHALVISGKEREVQYFLTLKKVIVNQPNEKGETALHFAAKHGHRVIIKMLIDAGANINAVDSKGLTPLHHAYLSKQEYSVRMLIKAHADTHIATPEGYTVFDSAIISKDYGAVQLFLDAGFNPSGLNLNRKNTFLMAALHINDLTLAKKLIQAGADLNEKDCEQKSTCLLQACALGNIKFVELLSRKGADLHAQMPNGKTPLMLAIQSGHLKIVEILIKYGVNIHQRDAGKSTPLMYAMHYGHPEMIKLLCAAGANVDDINDDGETVFDIAESMGKQDLALLCFDMAPEDVYCAPHGISAEEAAELMNEINKK